MKYKVLKDIKFVKHEQKRAWGWNDEKKSSRDCRNLVKELRQQAIKMLKFANYNSGEDQLLREFFSIEFDVINENIKEIEEE